MSGLPGPLVYVSSVASTFANFRQNASVSLSMFCDLSVNIYDYWNGRVFSMFVIKK